MIWDNIKCKCCGEEKPATEFYMHPKMSCGFAQPCKACKLKQTHDRRMSNPDAARAYDRETWKKRVKKWTKAKTGRPKYPTQSD